MLIVLVGFVAAEVEDDFDEDVVVEDDNGETADNDDGVTVEKVPVDIKYLSPDDNVDSISWTILTLQVPWG